MRLLATLVAVLCVGTVATQGLTAAVLYANGRLDGDRWGRIVAILDGTADDAQSPPDEPDALPGEAAAGGAAAGPVPTYEEVLDRRAMLGLELEARTEQLRSAARAVADAADAVERDRLAVAAAEDAFAADLAAARAELESESVEQVRGLLKGMGPKGSVAYLMTLPDDAGVTVLRGLDARTAAKILSEFDRGAEGERAKGATLFAGLHAGGPEAAALPDPAGPPGPAAGPAGQSSPRTAAGPPPPLR